MRACLFAAVAVASLQAAVVRGVVVENFTSKPLARAVVNLQPIAGTPGALRTKRADAHGGFVFDLLPAGAYIVRASRTNYMSAEYGQKRWNSAGTPFMLVNDDAGVFLNIRLFRYSAISGTVVDENDEGLPGQDVVAYRNSKPPELMAQATTDERGIYRLHGLEPGTYVVRTTGNQSNEGSFLPTFSKETDLLEQSRTIDLQPDQEAGDMDVRPIEGRLYSLSIAVEKTPPGADVSLTLASQMGRKTIKALSYRFAALPPGEYEIFAQSPAEPAEGEGIQGAYQRIVLGRDMSVTLILRDASGVTVVGEPAGAESELRIRRADLAGTGPTVVVPVVKGSAAIPAGRWEAMLDPPPGFYVASASGPGAMMAHSRADGWQEVVSPGFGGLRYRLSSGPSAVHGVVKNSDDAVPGAPVYLEAYDPVGRKRLADLRIASSDMHGQFRFDGLAPGAYRILSTFEYLAPDVETMDASGAQIIIVDTHSESSRDLELYLIR